MNTFHPAYSDLSDITAALQHHDNAGIDPAFDDDLEELERQFAELRLTRATH